MNLAYLSTFLSISLLGTTSLSPLTGDSYTIKMPTHLDLEDNGSFTVSIDENNILENDALNITFDDTFVLHDKHGKDDIYGNIQNGNLIFSMDNPNEKTVSYNVNDISVGEWYGDLNVTISLDRIEDNGTLKDGPTINKLLTSLNPTIITFSHDKINGDYLYDLSVEQDESILLYKNGNEVIITNGKSSPIKSGTDLSKLFNRISNLVAINNLDYLDTSECTNMTKMFQRSEALTSVDVSYFNTSNVTDMSYMFENLHGCTEIIGTENFDFSNVKTLKNFMNDDRLLTNLPDIGSYNITNKCTDLTAAFKAVGYKAGEYGSSVWPKNLDLSKWDVSSVTSLKETLYNSFGVEILNVSGWDTSKVKDMSGFLKMSDYSELSRLTTIIGFEDEDCWNVSNVTNMSNMFCECIELSNVDFSSWRPTSVTNISNMFYNNQSLDLHIFDDWGTYFDSSAVNKTGIFGNDAGCKVDTTYRPEWSK